THKRFGKGSIVKQNDSVIEIHFETERKKFVFPDAFGKFLKMHDEKAAHSLKKIIEEKELELEKIEQKKEEEKIRQRQEQQLRMEHEKLMKYHKLPPKTHMVCLFVDYEHSSV